MNRKQLLAIFAVGTFFGFGLQWILDQSEKDQIQASADDLALKVEKLDFKNTVLADENSSLARSIASEQLKLITLSNKIQELQDQKLQQYVTIQDVRKKLEIADDILGEIFVSFMTHLTLQPSPESRQYFAGKNSEGTSLDQDEEDEVKVSSDSAQVRRKPAPAKITLVKESNINEKKLDNAFQELKKSKTFSTMTTPLHQLQGLFSGQVVFTDKNKAPWQMEVEFAGQIVEGQLKGNLRVQLSENGQPFSTSRGEGDLKDLSQKESDGGIFIVTGENHVFQLYYLVGQDSFIGHYYKKQGIGEYNHAGSVKLRRY